MTTILHGDDVGFDLYPASDPKDGPRIRRFTSLQKGSFARREKDGTGSGAIIVPADSDDAEAIDTELLQYVKVERKGAVVTLALSAAADDTIDTLSAHGLLVGDKLEFVSLTGGTGLSTTPAYYVAAVPTTTSLKVATTKTLALAGTAVNFTTDITAGSIRKLTTLTGFFLYGGQVNILTDNGQKPLALTGPGTLAYLARAAMAPHSYLGDDPFDDIYRLHAQGAWFGTDALGSMFARAITEATLTQSDDPGDQPDSPSPNANDRLINPLPHLTLTFDGFTDSAGAAWTPWAGEFSVQVATENLLDIAMRFVQAGLELAIDPDQFELDAYNAGTLGTDRTGLAWGAGVVRFQVASAATVATGNILTTAKRALAAVIRRSLIWAGGQDVWGVARDSGAAIPWEGGYRSDANDETAANSVAAAQISARNDAGDVPRLRFKTGDDPSNGIYLPGPGGHFDVWDSTTLHSGTGRWDWNEQTVECAALEWRLRDDEAGEFDSYVEFGSTFMAIDQNLSFASGSRGCNCGPTLRLCERGSEIACADLTAADLTAGTATNGDAEDTDGGQWSGGSYQTSHKHAGSRSYGTFGDLDSTLVYTFAAAQSFSADVHYVIDVWTQRHSHVSVEIKFGVADGDEEISTDFATLEVATGIDGRQWARSRICWTPTADRTGVRFSWNEVQDNFSSDADEGTRLLIDDLALATTEATDPLPGTSPRAARCDHKHRHNDLLGRNAPEAHTASAIKVADVAGNFIEDNLEGVLAEIAARRAPSTGGTSSTVLGGFVAAALSNPPTAAEIETAIGSVKIAGTVYGLQDSGTEKRYLALSDGVQWHIVPLVVPQEQAGIVALTSAPDGGWSGGQPSAAHYNGTTYFAYIDGTSGDAEIRTYTHATGVISSPTVLHAALNADNHSGPALLVRSSDHKIMAFYSAHSGSALYQWVSDSAESIASGTETNLDSQLGGTAYSYPSIVEISGGLMLVVRPVIASTGQTWGYAISIDDGVTWPALTTYLQESGRRAYQTIAKTGANRVDVIASDGDSLSTDVSIIHFYYEDGGWFDSAGAAITLPADKAGATVVWDGTAGNDALSRDDVTLGPDDRPRVLFTVDLGSGSYAYYHGRWTGSAWITTQIATIANSLGGARFDSLNPLVVYAARDGDLWRYTTLDEETWTGEQLTSVTATDLFYPVSPTDHAPDLPVIWLHGTFTDYDTFSLGISGFGTSVAGATDDNLQRVVILDDTSLGEAILRRNSAGTWQISRDDGSTWESLGGSGTAFTVDAGTPTYDDSAGLQVSISSKFGIDSDGNPYFNSAGVTSGDEATLMRDSETGGYFLRPYTF